MTTLHEKRRARIAQAESAGRRFAQTLPRADLDNWAGSLCATLTRRLSPREANEWIARLEAQAQQAQAQGQP